VIAIDETGSASARLTLAGVQREAETQGQQTLLEEEPTP
jgi:hypothetical protein